MEELRALTTIGIICEYNPFHRGHAHQFAEIRRIFPDAAIVCLMSGCFTQRGSPALFSTSTRAAAALENGADLVLELPTAFAVRDAEHFALGGVSILERLGFVDYLSFGTEDELSVLKPAAELLEEPDEAFQSRLRSYLAAGLSHAASQGKTLEERFPEAKEAFHRPNNILALCYLRALRRLGSAMQPLPIRRKGDYHADTLSIGEFPSAKAVRASILAEDWTAAKAACGYELPRSPICPPTALDQALLFQLRNMTPEELRGYACCTEGLENRLLFATKETTSRKALLERVKTRRYSLTRLNRLLTQTMLFMDNALLQAYPEPAFVRLLGFRRNQKELLSQLKRSRIPVVSKAADADRAHPLFQLEERAYDLWALGAGLPACQLFRTQVVIR